MTTIEISPFLSGQLQAFRAAVRDLEAAQLSGSADSIRRCLHQYDLMAALVALALDQAASEKGV